MKDDAPPPAAVPRKRRQLESLPDRWIAEWLSGAYPLPRGDRLRLEAERERRKAVRRAEDRTVTVVIGPEGQTPQQRAAVADALAMLQPTQFHRPMILEHVRQAIRESDFVIAAPREATPPSDQQVRDRSWVWLAVDYAKHRRVPVKIIMPDGKEGEL